MTPYVHHEHRRSTYIDHGAETRAMIAVIDDYQKTTLLDFTCTVLIVLAVIGLLYAMAR